MRADAAAVRLESRRFCAARDEIDALQRRAIAAINDRSVPPDLQEELLGSVNALVEGVTCEPPGADDGAAEDARALAEWVRERSG